MKTQDMHDFARAILAAPPARTAPTLAEQVDRLGQIKAAQAELQAQFDKIRAELEEAGLKEIDGYQYRATFSTSTRTSTDWRTIAERFKPSPQLIRKHTTTPEGRPVLICPAQTAEYMTCALCGLCQRADRRQIIGFRAHGSKAKQADSRARKVIPIYREAACAQ